jgi:poly-gamma-glutamate synthesis protein (capsule biosynthesis protein)
MVALFPAASSARDISLLLTGDVFLGGKAEALIDSRGIGYPFSGTRDILSSADVVIANLESPFTMLREPEDAFMEKTYLLSTRPGLVDVLLDASIDVVTLANNHMMDFGVEGLRDTLAVLKRAGIRHAGAGEDRRAAREAAVFTVGEGDSAVRVAVLAYSKTFPMEFYAKRRRGGTAEGKRRYIRDDVKRAAKDADIVIVSFHWGGDRLKVPRAYQLELAHLAIDSGAKIVVGHHPHVLQPMESYKDGLIFYSLGNFVFGTYSEAEVEGALAKVVFTDKDSEDGSFTVKSSELILLDVNNWSVDCSPEIMKGAAKEAFFQDFNARALKEEVVAMP